MDKSCTRLKSYRPPRNYGELSSTIRRGALPCVGELHWLKGLGVSAIIDLTRRNRPTISNACGRLGLVYVKHPLSDTVVDPDGFRLAVELVWDYQPCYFHCWKGRHRTGVVAALIRRHQSWSVANTLAESQQFGFGYSKKHGDLWKFICTELDAT